MINKNLHKYLSRKNGNEIFIWTWNNPVDYKIVTYSVYDDVLEKMYEVHTVINPYTYE